MVDDHKKHERIPEPTTWTDAQGQQGYLNQVVRVLRNNFQGLDNAADALKTATDTLTTDLEALETDLTAEIDTKITGPASATNNAVVLFDGVTGKLAKDSTVILGTMASEDAADYTPTADLGTAAFEDTGFFATAAQGALADTALQPGDVGITLGTSQSVSGTENDISIPTGVKRVTLMFSGVSTNGTDNWLIQLGDAGGIETTGYLGGGTLIGATGVGTTNYTTGFGIRSANAANIAHGAVTLTKYEGGTNTWVCAGVLYLSSSNNGFTLAGIKPLSAELTTVRLTTLAGANTFDAGEINVAYEY